MRLTARDSADGGGETCDISIDLGDFIQVMTNKAVSERFEQRAVP